jgi:hypothetical protein
VSENVGTRRRVKNQKCRTYYSCACQTVSERVKKMWPNITIALALSPSPLQDRPNTTDPHEILRGIPYKISAKSTKSDEILRAPLAEHMQIQQNPLNFQGVPPCKNKCNGTKTNAILSGHSLQNAHFIKSNEISKGTPCEIGVNSIILPGPTYKLNAISNTSEEFFRGPLQNCYIFYKIQ